MKARNWLLMVLGLILAGAALGVGVNVVIDPYALYHDSRGQKRLVYGESRVAKYLLSVRYVPENFNAILIGSSVSANWNVAGVEKLHIYNESVNGANIVEEKAIVDQALSKPGISTVLLTIQPSLTASHDFATVRLDPALRFGALGSQNLVEAYKDMARRRTHTPFEVIDDRGSYTFGPLPSELNPILRKLLRPGMPLPIDPIALGAYRDLVAEIRARHIQIIFIVPPISESLFQAQRSGFLDYAALIEQSSAPENLLIDFTSDEFTPFRETSTNFADGVHLSAAAADAVVARINMRINGWIAQGRLRP